MKHVALVMVTLPNTDPNRSMHAVKHILKIEIEIEKAIHKQYKRQCHKCQAFGHVQRQGGRWTSMCEKLMDTPVTCSNCGGANLPSYCGCSQFPKPQFNFKKYKTVVQTRTPRGAQGNLHQHANNTSTDCRYNITSNKMSSQSLLRI